MHQYECDECGQLATIHETVIESGGAVVSRHHCQEHGPNELHDAARVDDPDNQAEFATLVEWYNALTDSETNRIRFEHRQIMRCSSPAG